MQADDAWKYGNIGLTLSGIWAASPVPSTVPTAIDYVSTAVGVAGTFSGNPAQDIASACNIPNINQSIRQTELLINEHISEANKAQTLIRETRAFLTENCGKCKK